MPGTGLTGYNAVWAARFWGCGIPEEVCVYPFLCHNDTNWQGGLCCRLHLFAMNDLRRNWFCFELQCVTRSCWGWKMVCSHSCSFNNALFSVVWSNDAVPCCPPKVSRRLTDSMKTGSTRLAYDNKVLIANLAMDLKSSPTFTNTA